MPTEFGPHLLGRKYVPDERDYHLGTFLSEDALDAALAAMLKSHLETKATKNWAKVITARVKALSPSPTPPNPSAVDKVWEDPEPTLDQGNFGTCVGNGWAQWGNTLPIDDRFVEYDARAIYYEATVHDGSPDDPDVPGGGQQGATVRSGAKAMQDRSRLTAYAFTTKLDEVKAWVQQHGPIVFGTDWTSAMFQPDQNGFITPSGSVEGGHCYVCVGDVPSMGALKFLNSWGADWGQGGYFYMKYSDANILLTQQGEACAAVELG